MMHYSGYQAWKEPRSFRIAFGSLLSVVAILFGACYAIPQLQRALVMKAMPQPLSWPELVRDGLGDNAHVELMGVTLAPDDDAMVAIEDQLREIQQQTAGETKEQLQSLLSGVEPRDLLAYALAPLKVVPEGVNADRIPANIVMSRLDPGVETARDESASHARITGYVRRAVDTGWMHQLFEKLGVTETMPSSTAKIRYVVSAATPVPDRNLSIGMVAASVLLGALGLVIAGSGGPSLWMWLFAPLPSLVSCIGYPLRYGRGSAKARMLYTVGGLLLIGTGGYLANDLGRLSHVDGDLLLQSLSMVVITLGVAAIVGARINARSATSIYNVLPMQPYKQPETDFRIQRLTPTASSVVEPVENDEYFDPRLSDASEAELPIAMQEQLAALDSGGFDLPKQIFVHEESRRRLTTLSLGCQGMVLCEIGQSGQTTLTRLMSVLTDGLVVITLSTNTPRVSSLRVGANGVYARAQGDTPIEMLSEHLERIAGIGEERAAQVVPIDGYEKLDVFLVGRRVLTDVQHEYDEVEQPVGKATYGRFAFPVRRVELLAAR